MQNDNGVPGSTRTNQALTAQKPRLRQWTKAELLSALNWNQFIPFYQPKVDLKTHCITGVEVLTRWNHPELGILLPSEFLAQLEQQGLIDKLTDCIIRQSLFFITEGAPIGHDISLAINVSPATLQAPGAADHFARSVHAFDVSAARLTIELTETVACETSVEVYEALMRLRALGFQISIDDFGTGYSSMKLLSKMPFTELKIDRSLVRGAGSDAKSAVILESVIKLARKLHLQTVAEGIENAEDVGLLRSLRCDVGQGYFLGLPMSEPDFTQYLQAGHGLPIAA